MSTSLKECKVIHGTSLYSKVRSSSHLNFCISARSFVCIPLKEDIKLSCFYSVTRSKSFICYTVCAFDDKSYLYNDKSFLLTNAPIEIINQISLSCSLQIWWVYYSLFQKIQKNTHTIFWTKYTRYSFQIPYQNSSLTPLFFFL